MRRIFTKPVAKRGHADRGANSPAGGASQNRRDSDVRRTTIVLTDTIERNLALLCAKEGVTRSAFIETLIRAELKKNGLRPDLAPKQLAVQY